MNEQELDHIIDTATADMIEREPSAALRHKVMARVRTSEATAPRRFVWATSGLAVAACVVFALVMMERTPPPLVQSAPVARPVVVERPTAASDQTDPLLEPASQAALPVARRRAPIRLPPDDLSTIEAITSDSLAVAPIELPPLGNQAASVEGLEIEALTIEPLTASND
jgi:hypothetical protein